VGIRYPIPQTGSPIRSVGKLKGLRKKFRRGGEGSWVKSLQNHTSNHPTEEKKDKIKEVKGFYSGFNKETIEGKENLLWRHQKKWHMKRKEIHWMLGSQATQKEKKIAMRKKAKGQFEKKGYPHNGGNFARNY